MHTLCVCVCMRAIRENRYLNAPKFYNLLELILYTIMQSAKVKVSRCFFFVVACCRCRRGVQQQNTMHGTLLRRQPEKWRIKTMIRTLGNKTVSSSNECRTMNGAAALYYNSPALDDSGSGSSSNGNGSSSGDRRRLGWWVALVGARDAFLEN